MTAAAAALYYHTNAIFLQWKIQKKSVHWRKMPQSHTTEQKQFKKYRWNVTSICLQYMAGTWTEWCMWYHTTWQTAGNYWDKSFIATFSINYEDTGRHCLPVINDKLIDSLNLPHSNYHQTCIFILWDQKINATRLFICSRQWMKNVLKSKSHNSQMP